MNYLTAFLLATFLSLNCFGQAETDTLKDDTEYIEIYIDKGGAFFLDGWKRTMTEFDEYLATTELKHAKLATVFPTPMSAFATVDKVNSRLERMKVKVLWFEDREYTKPALDEW